MQLRDRHPGAVRGQDSGDSREPDAGLYNSVRPSGEKRGAAPSVVSSVVRYSSPVWTAIASTSAWLGEDSSTRR